MALPLRSSHYDDFRRSVRYETTSTTHPVGQHLHVGPGASKQPEQGAKYRQGALPHLRPTEATFPRLVGAARCVGALIGWQHQYLYPAELGSDATGSPSPFRDPGLPAQGRCPAVNPPDLRAPGAGDTPGGLRFR